MVLLPAVLANCQCAPPRENVENAEARLVLPAATLEFGPVQEGRAETAAFTLQNQGQVALTVTASLLGSSEFELLAPTTLEIPPGASADLSVVFTPVGFGTDTAGLTLTTNDPTHPTVLVPVNGGPIAPVLSVSPNPVTFAGNALVLSSRVTVRNTGNAQLDVRQVGVEPGGNPDFSVESTVALPRVVNPGDALLFTVVYARSARTTQGTLTVSAAEPAGSASVQLMPLPVTACADGVDNDGDLLADFPDDPGCSSYDDMDENQNPTCLTGAQQPCGTDVGTCEPGTRTCVNSQWGPCMGAILPTAETCDGLDNDCANGPDDGLSNCCVGSACGSSGSSSGALPSSGSVSSSSSTPPSTSTTSSTSQSGSGSTSSSGASSVGTASSASAGSSGLGSSSSGAGLPSCTEETRALAPFAGGAGTAESPYVICTVPQLDELRNHLDSEFLLGADLDLAGSGFLPVGSETEPFAGVLDGDGHSIRGFTAHLPGEDRVGFFRVVEGATKISNLSFLDADVEGQDGVGALVGQSKAYSGLRYVNLHVTGTVHGRDRVGGLVGYDWSSAALGGITAQVNVTGQQHVGGVVGELAYNIVSDSVVEGRVEGTARVGGVVGRTYDGGVVRSESRAQVVGTESVGGVLGTMDRGVVLLCSAHGSVEGGTGAGGLVGQVYHGLVAHSFNTATVGGTQKVGGVVGANWGIVAFTFATGAVSGSTDVGGVVGYNDPSQTDPQGGVRHSFFATDATGQTSSAGGPGAQGKTLAELQLATTFDTYEVHTIWSLEDGRLPLFRTEDEPCVVGAAAFSGGSGTVADPYLLDDEDQLYHLNCNTYASFKLTADLDYRGRHAVPAVGGVLNRAPGSGPFFYDDAFSGTFDGAGHHIVGWRGAGRSMALFVRLSSGATVKNLHVDDVESLGAIGVGGVVAQSQGGTFMDIHVSGVVRGQSYVGGFADLAPRVGRRISSSVRVFAARDLGGLVGGSYENTLLEDVYSTGSVTGGAEGGCVGGLAAFLSGQVHRGYASGVVAGGSVLKGVACGTPGPTRTDLFWNTETMQVTSSDLGVGLTSAQMQQAESFPAFDFDTVWELLPGGFPTLRAPAGG